MELYLLLFTVMHLQSFAMIAEGACVEPCVYFGIGGSIARFPVQASTGKAVSGTKLETVYGNGSRIGPLALDHAKQRIFWYDVGTRQIYRASFNGSNVQALIKYGVSLCEGIAYDWSTDNIYWTDAMHDWIEVASADGKDRMVLIQGNMEEPRAIAVTPLDGFLFWTDWGSSPRIERATLDGKDRRSIVTTNLVWPNDIAIDFSAKRVYWIDAKTDKIWSVDYAGGVRRYHADVSRYGPHLILIHPYSMALFAQHSLAYFTDWYRSIVLYQKLGTTNLEIAVNGIFQYKRIGQVRLLHSSNQPASSSQCAVNSSLCSHICMKNGAQNYTCACPTGTRPSRHDSKDTCQKADLDYQIFLLDGTGSATKILHLSKFIGQPQYLFDALSVPRSGRPVGIDFDQRNNILYWTDVHQDKIIKMFVNGTGYKVLANETLLTPEGLSIDVGSQLLYFADYGRETIEVLKLDGSTRKILMSTNLVNPRDIQLYHEKGLMFFSDWGTHPKIESAYMDGTRRLTIISTDLRYPSGLAIDKIEERIYWSDMGLDRIESSHLDGSDRRILYDHYGYNPYYPIDGITGEIQTPYGLAVFRNRIFWTDWSSRAIYSADKRTGGKINLISGGLAKPMQLHVYSNKTQKVVNAGFCPMFTCKVGAPHVKNCSFDEDCSDHQKCCNTSCGTKCLNSTAKPALHPCEKQNGGCSHFCFRLPRGHTCSCPNTMLLQPADNKTCISKSGHCALNKPCANNGVCTDDGTTFYKCKCLPGYTGSRCENWSQCYSNPCFNNGSCIAGTSGDYNCQCMSGYTGRNCETSVFCLSNPCRNGGRCAAAIEGGYKCQCISGYTGRRCETNITCSSNPCLNNGSCIVANSGKYKCYCNSGYTGKNCEMYIPCLPNPCLNNGSCISRAGGGYICKCTLGFFGWNCGSTVCNPNPCSNSGRCVITAGSYKCQCLSNFTGKYCEQCMPNPCLNNGTCLGFHSGHMYCQCRPGYTGRHCEIATACMSNPCLNNGSCALDNSGRYKCYCNSGYTGKTCETYIPCLPNPCLNNGSCIARAGGGYTCQCTPGFFGGNCRFTLCYPNPCYNGGRCNITAGSYKCQCLPDFTGKNCETCSPCLNNGTCNGFHLGRIYCQCRPGYTGRHCEIATACVSNPCKNNGTCHFNNGQLSCSCPLNTTGERCEHLLACLPVYCQNNGRCSLIAGQARCICQPGFTGSHCESFIGCWSGYCKNGGQCVIEGDVFNLRCNCATGYTGSTCESAIDHCIGHLCKNGSTCMSSRSGYTCQCAADFTGALCDHKIDNCVGALCENSGTCIDGIESYKCQCMQYFTGLHCESVVDMCQTKPCLNNGVCEVKKVEMGRALPFVCHCDNNFTGSFCQLSYGNNLVQVRLTTTVQNLPQVPEIKKQLAAEYTAYCANNNCADNTASPLIRKKRQSPAVFTVSANDVIIPKGFPKSFGSSETELRYAVVAKTTGGGALVLSSNVAIAGLKAFKQKMETFFGGKIKSIAVAGKSGAIISPTELPLSNQTSSSKRDLAIGLVVGAMFVVFFVLLIFYLYKRRERNERKTPNVVYQSHEEPRLEIRKQPALHQESHVQGDFKHMRFEDNNAYGMGHGNDAPHETSFIDMEMNDKMTGVVNPYAELPDEKITEEYVMMSNSAAMIRDSQLSGLTSLDADAISPIAMGSIAGLAVATASHGSRPVSAGSIRSVNGEPIPQKSIIHVEAVELTVDDKYSSNVYEEVHDSDVAEKNDAVATFGFDNPIYDVCSSKDESSA
eukprot:gene2952-3402_t